VDRAASGLTASAITTATEERSAVVRGVALVRVAERRRGVSTLVLPG
jgi:hypothetical protein